MVDPPTTSQQPQAWGRDSGGDHGATPTLLVLPTLPPSLLAAPWFGKWSKLDHIKLTGYQVWAVEQRLTERTALLPIITVFTGSKDEAIVADRYQLNPHLKLSESEQLNEWDKIKTLFKKAGARMSNTPLGYIPVTALPSLAPNLSLVQLPNGKDYASIMTLLYQNINLRRLGLGGRSSLRLVQATPAQMLHFRQSYHIPIPPPSSTSSSYQPIPFGETVLSLIRLVQHALSLFNLGVVLTPSLIPSSSSSTGEELDRSLRIREGDGLLCDTTLSALALFRVEFAEPLLRLPDEGESNLSPSLLASLLSLVLGTRGKLILLGAHGVPKDPFERRTKFLKSLVVFEREQRFSKVEGWVTTGFLDELNKRYLTSRKETTGRKVVGRALKLVPVVGTVVGSDGQEEGGAGTSVVGRPSKHRHKGEEAETIDLERLIREMARGVGGATTARMWDLRRGRKDRREDERERREEEEEGSNTDGIGAGTPSEGETLGFGRGVLKGVRERAGRAGRKFGDNLGLTESHLASQALHGHAAHPQGHETPSVIVSSPDPGSIRSSRVSTFDSRRTSTHKSTMSSTNDPEPSQGRSGGFASRLASALTVEHASGSVQAVRNRFASHSPAPSSSNRPEPSSKPSSLLGVGEPRISMPRRTVSEAMTVPTLGSIPSLDPARALDELMPVTGIISQSEDSERPAMVPTLVGRARRHSFNVISDAEEPFEWLSRRRLELDVEMRVGAWMLRRREIKLQEIKNSLRVVLSSYESALDSLSHPLAHKVDMLNSLSQRATEVQEKVEKLTSPGSTLSELSISTSRILYAQDALERNNISEAQSSRTTMARSIGTGGVLRDVIAKIAKERKGMRRLVGSLDRWQRWLGFLARRGRWHVWRVTTQANKDEAEKEQPRS